MGVLFGDTHSDTLEIIHTSTNIGEAEPIIKTIEIPGTNNKLDLSEAYGAVLYNQRTLVFGFHILKSRSECLEKFTEVRNLLNGKRMDIVWGEDSDYVYNGRAKVTAYMDKSVGVIEVEAICGPYKLRNEITAVTVEVDEEQEVELYNECMPTFPVITIDVEEDESMTLEFESISKSLASGTYYVTDFMLKQGINNITCSGTGTVTFEYQEGAL